MTDRERTLCEEFDKEYTKNPKAFIGTIMAEVGKVTGATPLEISDALCVDYDETHRGED